jgi:hypothetical protein
MWVLLRRRLAMPLAGMQILFRTVLHSDDLLELRRHPVYMNCSIHPNSADAMTCLHKLAHTTSWYRDHLRCHFGMYELLASFGLYTSPIKMTVEIINSMKGSHALSCRNVMHRSNDVCFHITIHIQFHINFIDSWHVFTVSFMMTEAGCLMVDAIP